MTLLHRSGVCAMSTIMAYLISVSSQAQEGFPTPLRKGAIEMTQKFQSGIRTERPGIAFFQQTKDGFLPWLEVSTSQLAEVLSSLDGSSEIKELALQYVASCDLTASDPVEARCLRQDEKDRRSRLFHSVDLLMREEFPEISASFYGLIVHEYLHNLELELQYK